MRIMGRFSGVSFHATNLGKVIKVCALESPQNRRNKNILQVRIRIQNDRCRLE